MEWNWEGQEEEGSSDDEWTFLLAGYSPNCIIQEHLFAGPQTNHHSLYW